MSLNFPGLYVDFGLSMLMKGGLALTLSSVNVDHSALDLPLAGQVIGILSSSESVTSN